MPDGVEHGVQHRGHAGAFERDVGPAPPVSSRTRGGDVLLAGVQHMVRDATGRGLFLARLGQFADYRGHPHALEDGGGEQPDGPWTRPHQARYLSFLASCGY